MEQQVHDFFNKTDNYLHRNFGVRVRAEIVHELIENPHGKEILDAGCGDGGITRQFLPENRVTFLDVSENMIALVKNNIPVNYLPLTSYFNGTLNNFPDGKHFEIVIAIGLLAHVPSVQQTLVKIKELLTANGVALIQFSNYNSPLVKLNVGIAKRYNYPLNKIHYDSFRASVISTGFDIEREVRFSLLLPGMGILPDKFLYKYSTLIRKNKMTSRFGTDFIWLLRKR